MTSLPDKLRIGRAREGSSPLSRAPTPARTTRRERRFSGDVKGAILLIAPLALFMLVFFLVPIVALITRATWDPAVATAFPRTAQALAAWNGEQIPPPTAFAALAADVPAADDSGTLGDALTRLNGDRPGMRALLLHARDQLENAAASGPTPTDPDAVRTGLVTLDPRWDDLATWQVLARAVHPATATSMLRAFDHALTPDGHVVPMPNGEGVYLQILGRTIWISVIVTAIVVLLGFPLSYALALMRPRQQGIVLMAVLVPFWTSILVRMAAWMVVLSRGGLVNRLAQSLHVINGPLDLLYNRVGVVVAMVHILIPFLVLPLFAVMRGIPPSYRRAAISLGSHPFSAFWRVYVPQTVPGVTSGALLVFISALGYYIAPALLGGSGDQMISYYIAYYTNTVLDWGLAAALSVLLLAATALLFLVYRALAAWRPSRQAH